MHVTSHTHIYIFLTEMKPDEVGRGNLLEKRSLEDIEGLWDAWEIHCLVLTSLFLQVVLFFMADIRRHCASRLLNMVLWLAYVSADTVAVFVLGHLAVHTGETGHQLMALWAPFMLIHLGGQETITAFSRQDNELWLRHLLNLVTQVAVAGYVVTKAPWPDHRLKATMLLLFFSGCVKYAERTWCLYMASPAKLRSAALMDLSDTLETLEQIKHRVKGGDLRERESLNQLYGAQLEMIFEYSLSEYNYPRLKPGADIMIMSVDAPHNNPRKVFSSVHELAHILSEYKRPREGRCAAYRYVGASLVGCYQMLYTKNSLRESSWVVWAQIFSATYIWCATVSISLLVHPALLLFNIFPCIFVLLCTIFISIYIIVVNTSSLIALLLFWVAEKGGHSHTSRADITVSYILLGGALAIDVCSATKLIISSMRSSNLLPARISKAWLPKQWSEELAQYSMIMRHSTSCRASMWRWISRLLGSWCSELIEVAHTPPIKKDERSSIKELVLDSLLDFGARGEWDIASSRGKLALQKLPVPPAVEESIGSSSVDFPTSVLIWHIATDMCYYKSSAGNSSQSSNSGPMKERKEVCRELSNYIMYLVFKCRVTLTSRSQLMHDKAHEEIKEILKTCRNPDLEGNNPGDEKDAVLSLLDVEQQHHSAEEIQEEHKEPDFTNFSADEDIQVYKLVKTAAESLYSPVLPRARAVAKELINSIVDETERWDLIAGVWLEMLYYVAPRCGAAFHYEHLSTGGEFITHVLALMRELGPFLPNPT